MKLKIQLRTCGLNVECRDVKDASGNVTGHLFQDESGTKLLQVNKNGDLVDLFAYRTVDMKCPHVKDEGGVVFDFNLIPLGVAMKLPDGMKANVYPRSSLFSKKGVILANSVGQIDNSYCGDSDVWMFGALAFNNTTIEEGERIAQFEVVPGKNATPWQKLKWLLSDGYEFEFVDSLGDGNRGGIGSTGGYR